MSNGPPPADVVQRTVRCFKGSLAQSHLHLRLRRISVILGPFCRIYIYIYIRRCKCGRCWSSFRGTVIGSAGLEKRMTDEETNIRYRGEAETRLTKTDFSSKRSGLKLVYLWKPISFSFVALRHFLPDIRAIFLL